MHAGPITPCISESTLSSLQAQFDEQILDIPEADT
jgi:hypothetical protein